MIVEIPHYKTLELQHIVLDFNGTIAKDGKLLVGVGPLIDRLAEEFKIYVITADTHGSVEKEMAGAKVRVAVLTSGDHTNEKEAFIRSLGADSVAALGNGANDAGMLKAAALGVAIVGDEGCATQTLLASDMVCRNIVEALELFVKPRNLIATLRR